ncbi:hypothetical protein [Micromonospora sp. CPCC 206061]|uniref:hypothetical protein n=1 Tax=Micromonospora sp. CPCC 206061 TaxID=3122410 RepID=UPI002FF238A6
MTILIFLAGFAAAVGAVVGYVAWRDRHRRGTHTDPSISRAAFAEAQWQGAKGYAADTNVTGTSLPRHQTRAHHRHDSS